MNSYGNIFKWNTYFPNVHLVSPIPCLSLHGLIVAHGHLRDWHSVICLFSPNFPFVRISEFILDLDQTAALLCNYYDYTPKISILKDLQLFKMPVLCCILISASVESWIIIIGINSRFQCFIQQLVVYFYFFTWALVCTQVKPEYKVSDHWWQIGKWRESYLCTMWNEIIWTKWYQFCFLIKA